MDTDFEIRDEEVAAIFEIALEMQISSAVDQCLFFVDANIERLIENEELFTSFPYHLIKEIVGRDTLQVRQIELFKALVKWWRRNRSFSFGEVFRDFRWHLISAHDFASYVRPMHLISDEEYFESFMQSKRSENDYVDFIDR